MAGHVSWAEQAGQVVSVSGKVMLRNEKSGQPKTMKPGAVLTRGDIINTSSDGNAKILMSDQSIVDLGPTTLFKVDEYQGGGGNDRKVELSMDYGKVRAAVNKPLGPSGKFKFKTKSATMGVRGTEFVVMTDLAAISAGEPAPAKPAAAQASGESAPAESVKSKAAAATDKTQIVVVEGKVEVATESEAGKKESHQLTEGSKLTTESVDQEMAKESGLDEKEVKQAAAEVEKPKVEKVSIEEVKEVAKEVKVQDNTFERAVVIEPSSGEGGSKQGSDTLALFSESFELPEGFVPTVADLGLPGTFGANLGIPSYYNPGFVGGNVTLKVVFQP